MISKLKPYPSYKDSGVPWLGKVPEHWEVSRIRNAAEMRVSNVDKHSNEKETPVRLCNYVDVYKHDRIHSEMPFMRATASQAEIDRFRLEIGDVLITKDSEIWNDIGVPALVEQSADDLICGYHLAILRSFQDRLNSAFLFRALQSTPVACQFHVKANGVTRYGLSHSAIRSVWIPLPPLNEQALAIRFLNGIDRKIRRYIRAKQKLIKLLEEQKQAIIHRTVTRGLNPNVRLKPSGVEWLGDIPEHWKTSRAKYLFREVDCRTDTGMELLLSLRMYKGLVPHEEVSSIPITPKALIGFKKVYPGQIIMNRMRAAIGLFGITSQPGLVSPDYAVFEPIGDIEAYYFLRLFKTPTLGKVFRLESKGLGTGSSGFMRLYTDRFGMVKFPVPPLEEQKRIVDSINKSTQEIEQAQNQAAEQVALLREYRTRMIADVVTGKLDVREAAANLPEETEDQEPPEELDSLAEAEDLQEDSEAAGEFEEAEA